ncbi:MAG: ABC transporter ATP-binding protein [Planctomycetaceae bacterium]
MVATAPEQPLPPDATWRKAWAMLTRGQRSEALFLVACMMFGAILETLGIGAVVPALIVMSSEEALRSFPAAALLVDRLGRPSHATLIVAGLLLLLGIYAFKSLYLLWLAWRQSRFLTNVQRSVTQRLFDTYLAQPWSFHLQRNSADLVRNVTTEMGVFSNALVSIMMAGIDVMMLVSVAGLLVFVQPVGAMLVVATLGVSTWVLQRYTRSLLTRMGRVRLDQSALRAIHLTQGLGGIKEIKVRSAEPAFSRRFRQHDDAMMRAVHRQMFLVNIPRLWFEMVAVAVICLLALTMLLQGISPDVFVPTLGLFAAAAFRILPSVNRLTLAFQAFRYCGPSIETLHAELALPRVAVGGVSERLQFREGLQLDGVSFAYPGTSDLVLRDVSLRIPRGSAVGFIGESGAGKSTLVDVLLGLLEPTAGRVLADGQDIARAPGSWQNIVGYVPQSIYLCDDSLRRNVAFGLDPAEIDDEAVRRAIRAAQLDDFVATLPEGLETVVGERGVRLSGGQRQRIGIARALYHDPDVLVLDEATSALDADTERGVMEAVDSLHGAKTLIIVAHRLGTVANCDVIHRMRGGRIVTSGSLEEVTAS